MPELEFAAHERFCIEYVWDLDPGAAIIRTQHYKRQHWDGGEVVEEIPLEPFNKRDINYAAKIARRLLRYADVSDRIEELIDEKKLHTKVQHEQITARLLKIAEYEPKAEPTHSEVLSAVEKLAKHVLYYEDSDKGKMKTFAEAMKELLHDDSHEGQNDSPASPGDVQEG